jgi:hypothetical protein
MILLVDGSSGTVEMDALALSSAGYWVLIATNAHTAERTVKNHRRRDRRGIARHRGLGVDPRSKSTPLSPRYPGGNHRSFRVGMEAEARKLECAMVWQKPLADELMSVIRRLLRPAQRGEGNDDHETR